MVWTEEGVLDPKNVRKALAACRAGQYKEADWLLAHLEYQQSSESTIPDEVWQERRWNDWKDLITFVNFMELEKSIEPTTAENIRNKLYNLQPPPVKYKDEQDEEDEEDEKDKDLPEKLSCKDKNSEIILNNYKEMTGTYVCSSCNHYFNIITTQELKKNGIHSQPSFCPMCSVSCSFIMQNIIDYSIDHGISKDTTGIN